MLPSRRKNNSGDNEQIGTVGHLTLTERSPFLELDIVAAQQVLQITQPRLGKIVQTGLPMPCGEENPRLRARHELEDGARKQLFALEPGHLHVEDTDVPMEKIVTEQRVIII